MHIHNLKYIKCSLKKTAPIASFLAGDHTIIQEVLLPIAIWTKNDNIEIGYSLALATFPIGKSSLPHRLASGEVYIITEGKGKVFINEKNKIINQGDVVFIPPNATQYIENIGDEILKFYCIVHPEWSTDE